MHQQSATDDPRIDAARFRLQSVAAREDAFEAIREIIANLFGSEEIALYRIDQDRAVLWLLWSFGIDPHTHSMVDLLNEPALAQLLRGETLVADPKNGLKLANIDSTATAFVPVRFKDHTLAVLAVFKLLAQKQAIDQADHDLFAVLSTEIGNALFSERDKPFISQLLEENL